MSWTSFPYFAMPALLCWIFGACMALKGKRSMTLFCYLSGLLVFSAFMGSMWLALQRPPMRTMGETRLWYVFFLNLAGLLVYLRRKFRWIPSFSALMSAVFILVNILKPEIHDKELVPALQSGWFVPHVIMYMFAYALLASSFLLALHQLFFKKGKDASEEMSMTDNLTAIGLSFLTVGMLFGAMWAKEAWGHYWGWDPKETWAAATWMCYLCQIHIRCTNPKKEKLALAILLVGFVFLQICWWGVNYLPSAQGASVHIYGKS